MTGTDAPGSLRKDRVRFAILVKRRKDMSYEEFADYWLNHHAKVFMGTRIVHKSLLRYEQMHTSAQTAKAWNELNGIPITEYDGIAMFEADSFQDIQDMWASDEYKAIIAPDELKFADLENSQVIPLQFWVGFDHTKCSAKL
ncbi:EthD domain-containing protein [Schizophyllum amplum]|uniref:EthD domain-containing protein n=1 Tax=Schizophyllum amplum TaxID=97359 RepID=A0A550CHC7_9AGAR|nr:EthD domain-containing protein [Auriculariopsis ampla]